MFFFLSLLSLSDIINDTVPLLLLLLMRVRAFGMFVRNLVCNNTAIYCSIILLWRSECRDPCERALAIGAIMIKYGC